MKGEQTILNVNFLKNEIRDIFENKILYASLIMKEILDGFVKGSLGTSLSTQTAATPTMATTTASASPSAPATLLLTARTLSTATTASLE